MKRRNIFLGTVAALLLLAGCAGTAQEAPPAASAAASTAASAEAIAESAPAGAYADGTYSGVARGYKKGLHVDVTVSGGRISDIQVGAHNEDEPYLTDSLVVIPQIIETQSTQVDIVAGATKTCEGIAKAVDDALLQAAP